jgi:hypothetical protein
MLDISWERWNDGLVGEVGELYYMHFCEHLS